MSYKKQKLLTIHEHLGLPKGWGVFFFFFFFSLWDPCYAPCCFAKIVQWIRSLDCPLLIDSTVSLAEFKIGMSEIYLLFLLFKINTQIMFGFFPFNNQGSVVELLIKLIISLTLITFLIPNHIIS